MPKFKNLFTYLFAAVLPILVAATFFSQAVTSDQNLKKKFQNLVGITTNQSEFKNSNNKNSEIKRNAKKNEEPIQDIENQESDVLGVSVSEAMKDEQTTEGKVGVVTQVLDSILKVGEENYGYFNKIKVKGRVSEPKLSDLSDKEAYLWTSQGNTKLFLSSFGERRVEILTNKFFGRSLTFSKNISINRDLILGGTAYIDGDIDILGNIDGTTATLSSVYLTGNLVAVGDISAANAKLSGDLEADGDLYATNTYLTGDLDADGDLTANDIYISGNFSAALASVESLGIINGFSSATGKVSGNFSAGSVVISGNSQLDTLTAANTYINGTLRATGNSQLDTLTAANTYINGTLVASGTSSLQNLTAANGFFNGLVTITGDLSADITKFNRLGVNGPFSASSAFLTGNLSAASAFINGYFSAGNASLGATTINGNLSAALGALSQLGVSGEFSASSGFISNLGVTSNFSGANGNFTSNLYANVFSAGSASINGYFSAGAASLAAATINGNLIASIGSFTTLGVSGAFSAGSGLFTNFGVANNFSAGNSTLGATTINGRLYANTLATERIEIGSASFSDESGGYFNLKSDSRSIKISSGDDKKVFIQQANADLAEFGFENIVFYKNLTAGTASLNSSTVEGQLDVRSGNVGSIRLRTLNQAFLELSSPGASATINLSGNNNFINSPTNLNFSLGTKPTLTVNFTTRNIATEASSDLRLKAGVQTIDNALEKITQLRGVYYNMRENYTSPETLPNREFGMLAQEVDDVFPNQLVGNTPDGFYTLDYGKLTALLVEGIKAQQIQIGDLSGAVGALNLAELQDLYNEFNSSLVNLSMSTGATGALVVNSNLTVTGEALFNNATFTGDVTIGQVKVDTLENDISIDTSSCVDMDGNLNEANCDANKLNIMKNKAGNVEIFDGKVRFKPNGEVLGEKVQAKTFKNNNSTAPSAGDSCTAGEFKFAEESGNAYIFYCTSDSNWVRSALNNY